MDSSAKLSPLFVIIVAAFVVCLIASNIISVKLIDVLGYTLPAATIVFPISYIIGDVLTEVYGYDQARRVIWLGFACNLFVTLAIKAAIVLPPSRFWPMQQAFEQTLGSTPHILIASFTAYLVGEFGNAYVLARLKVLTRGRWLWMRTIGSTLVGEGLDSLLFITIAFHDQLPVNAMLSVILSQWLVKSSYEALATPLTYIVVAYAKRREQCDVYDKMTNFSPFSLKA